jgi:hypothetical protein
MNARFSVGDFRNLPDLSPIHGAISPRLCNIHIDEMGFVLADEKGNAIYDPDALRHILVELVWKANLQGKLPFWALDRINLHIASSPLAFSRVGIGVDVKKSKRLTVSLLQQSMARWNVPVRSPSGAVSGNLLAAAYTCSGRLCTTGAHVSIGG